MTLCGACLGFRRPVAGGPGPRGIGEVRPRSTAGQKPGRFACRTLGDHMGALGGPADVLLRADRAIVEGTERPAAVAVRDGRIVAIDAAEVPARRVVELGPEVV